MSIILFHFESSEIRFVGTAEKPEWVALDICKVLGIGNPSASMQNFLESQKGITTIDDGSLTGVQALTVTQSGLYRLIFKSRKPIAEKFQNWVFEEVLPSIAKTGAYQTEQKRAQLERRFQPTPPIKQLKEMYGVNKMMHGKPYADRWMAQMQQRHYPALVGDAPQPEELVSLPTARALLNPTKIAEELGWLCKTGKCSGNASKVNSLLKELGYQDMIGGRWSATDKAIAASLVDRKPVETNSRTQKDQLLWSADIISILQEYSIPSPTPAC